MTGNIAIENKKKNITEIQIEGTIGVPENVQFENPEEKIATYQKFQNIIRNISQIQTKTIIVNIRSTGGNVNDALLIYDALTALNAKIITRCYGYVASAATIIAQAAQKGKRQISKNALYLIHQASSTAEGNAKELSQTVDLLGKTDERIADIYADASGNLPQKYIELMKENNGNGKWLSAEETIKEGLADQIIPAAKITNDAKDEIKKMNLPEIPEQYDEALTKKSGKIKKQWNAILDSLKSDIQEDIKEKAEDIQLKNNIEKRVEAMNELEKQIIQYGKESCEDTDIKINQLKNRIAELEALNAKLRAKATLTIPKEDPSFKEIKRAGNAAAYDNDIQNLLNN